MTAIEMYNNGLVSYKMTLIEKLEGTSQIQQLVIAKQMIRNTGSSL